jgi:hypothetical protein
VKAFREGACETISKATEGNKMCDTMRMEFYSCFVSNEAQKAVSIVSGEKELRN